MSPKEIMTLGTHFSGRTVLFLALNWATPDSYKLFTCRLW